VRQARNVGYDEVLGELAGGIDAWIAAGRTVETTPIVAAARADGTVIDVRQAAEFDTGHLPNAVNVELGALDTTAIPAGPIAVMCGHGERAMTAASVLAARNRRDVTVLTGGPEDWDLSPGMLATGR
jgi:rhodanese-related sulfurtransferase